MKKLPIVLSLLIGLCLSGCEDIVPAPYQEASPTMTTQPMGLEEAIQTTIGTTTVVPYAAVNDNVPMFTEADITTEAFETYSELDYLGRCGVAYANICQELMPTEERGEIGMIKPTGWHTVRYDDIIKDKYLYNRSHLIGFQLAGENANEQNLITGTRYMNVDGMLPFENQVADYVQDTNNHVLYRVTPIFDGEDLVAKGVLMEAYSVEDEGQGCQFCVFCPNVQPGIGIDYATGDSWEDSNVTAASTEESTPSGEATYILNTRSMKFHLPSCENASSIAEYNREETSQTREELIQDGYTPCGVCHP